MPAEIKHSNQTCRINGISAVRGTNIRTESQFPDTLSPPLYLNPADISPRVESTRFLGHSLV